MAGMARSGETLMLRTLAAHPQVHVVHNLAHQDSPEELELFRFLMHYDRPAIAAGHPLIARLGLRPDQVLLLKQGVWEHRHPFNGFILARNPVSIYASLLRYDVPRAGADPAACWQPNLERFQRWLGDIEPGLIPRLRAVAPVDQFCLFYNRRMGPLARLGLPVVHYERFVTEPAAVLAGILGRLGLGEPMPAILEAHTRFAAGMEGHGQNDLSRPIDTRSLTTYRDSVDPETYRRIAAQTADVAAAFGYQMEWMNLRIVDRGGTAWAEPPGPTP
jgi:hypothetical protein